MLEKVPILKPERIPVESEVILRYAYAPDATHEEKDTGRRLFARSLRLVIIAACEDRDWVAGFLERRGAGRLLSVVVARVLAKLCKIL